MRPCRHFPPASVNGGGVRMRVHRRWRQVRIGRTPRPSNPRALYHVKQLLPRVHACLDVDMPDVRLGRVERDVQLIGDVVDRTPL